MSVSAFVFTADLLGPEAEDGRLPRSEQEAKRRPALTRKGFGPFDGGDDLPPSQPIEGGHQPGGGVGDGAVVAGVDGLGLDGPQQGQHGWSQLRHGLGHQGLGPFFRNRGGGLHWGALPFESDQLLGLPR